MEIQSLRDLSQETIETERLSLVPISIEYAEQMYQELTDEVTRFMGIFSPKSIEEELSFIKGAREKMVHGTDLYLAILDRNTREYLGGVGLHQIDTGIPKLGIWLKKDAHGKKIGREAVTGVKHWADENLDFDYLAYPVDKDNIPSRKIAESLGGQVVWEGPITSPFGKELNEVKYHIPRASNS